MAVKTVSKWQPKNGPSAVRRRVRVLTAAAQKIDLDSKEDAQRQRMLRQNWQLQAWTYYDSIPELGFGLDFRAHSAARMRLFIAALNDDGESDMPVSLDDPIINAPPEVIEACTNALRDLGNGRVALANIMESLSLNVSVAGECFLLGQEDPINGVLSWSIRSIEEIVIYNDQVMLREGPMTNQGFLGLVPLDPNLTYVTRMWKPHPRFRLLAQSEMRRLANSCEDLLIMRRIIRATGRSRLAGRGILLMPTEIDIPVLNDDNSSGGDDDFVSKFTDAMITPIRNEGDASAVVPLVVEGPADVLDKVRWIDFVSEFDKQASEVRNELVEVIARGLDMPVEVITGIMDANHWTAYMVSTDTFRSYTEPHIITLVEMLTASFLRPYFSTCNLPQSTIDAWVGRIVIWYDPTELVTPTDLTKTAMDLHDRGVISNKTLRRVSGFTEEDAPTADEFLAWLISKQRTWPANLSEAVIHGLAPNLSVPPITVAGTIPGIKPGPGGGVDVGTPATPALPAGAPPAVPGPSAGPDLTANADGSGAIGAMLLDMFLRERAGQMAMAAEPVTVLTASATVKPSAKSRRLSRQLLDIDREFRSKLQTAANIEMKRQLEKAGHRVRTKVGSDKLTREKIAMTRNEHVLMTLGREEVERHGFTASALMETEWDSLRDQYDELTKHYQARALAVAIALAGINEDAPQVRKAKANFAAGATAGWLVLKNAMDEIAVNAAYNPDPNVSTDEAIANLSATNIVPAGVVRTSIAIAGGASVANFVMTALSNGATVPSVPLSPVGGIGTGGVVSGLLSDSGAVNTNYEWVHGPSLKVFQPHEDLDGTEFDLFTSDALANTSGNWPYVAYYYPGDHDGCLCDAMPLWVGAPDVAAAEAVLAGS